MKDEELDAIAQRAEKDANELNSQLDIVSRRLMKAEESTKAKTQKIIILRGELGAMTQRAETAERECSVLRASTEAAAMIYLRSELDQSRVSLAAATARAEAAEKDANELRADNEMNNHYAGRALDAERKLAAATARAEAAEAKLAQVQRYSAYVASAWLQGSSAFFFEDWLAQRGEAHPRGAPTAVFDASDFEVDESEVQP